MSSPINVNRWQNKVRAIFGIRGGNPIPNLEDLRPVVVVEHDRPEWSFAGTEQLVSASVTQTADAANPSRVRLVNPANTGILVVVELFILNLSVTGYVRLLSGTTVAALASGESVPSSRDTRGTPLPSSALRLSSENTAGSGAGLGRIRVPSTQGLLVPNNPVILAPGTNVDLDTLSNNTELSVFFHARERVLERGLPS